MRSVILRRATLSDTNFRFAEMSKACLVSCVAKRCNLMHVCLLHANCSYAVFDESDMREARCERADLAPSKLGGATALFAKGANETVIRTMGRWSSDLHRLYVRACFEQCVQSTQRAGSAQVYDLAGEFDEVDYY